MDLDNIQYMNESQWIKNDPKYKCIKVGLLFFLRVLFKFFLLRGALKNADFEEIVLKGCWVPISKPNFFLYRN